MKKNGHVIWFTGLSGSGKTTLANAVKSKLESKHDVYILDGDNVRTGLCSDLGFSPSDRKENIRRAAELSKIVMDLGYIVISTFISPYIADRQNAREVIGNENFFEVFIKCNIIECIRRDPKGLYSKALKGIIPEFTGISAPYEEPIKPELIVDTEVATVDETADFIIKAFEKVLDI